MVFFIHNREYILVFSHWINPAENNKLENTK